MNDWQIVPKRGTVSGLKFRRKGKYGKLMVYIGSGLRKELKKFRQNSWCNIYHKRDSLMIQLTCSPDSNSRRVWRGVFCLPYELVRQHWQGDRGEIEIPAKVEKGSLLLVDLRDLGK